MSSPLHQSLQISAGQYSDKGRKETNQDFHGLYLPKEPQLSTKGVAVALADGISSSSVSQVASQAAVTGFLEDYYCTSDAWSVKTSAMRILDATNAWLHAQTQRSPYRYDKDRGYVCTFSALVIKSHTAHIFHVGDARIYRLQGKALEQLTNDHRVWLGQGHSQLSRALGVSPQLDIDYQALPVEQGDVFVLATDGVYEHASAKFIVQTIAACINQADANQPDTGQLDEAARLIGQEALQQGSPDNLTVQIVRINSLPSGEAGEIYQHLAQLPLPPLLEARALFDGYRIVRELHASSRSHIYLALDGETNHLVVLKTPSIDLQGDTVYLERFLGEEWVARRIQSAHVLKAIAATRKRNFVYVVTEYIEGQTLAQWMVDNPRPALETVRGLVEQIAKGLRAFHRLEMLHQDLRPQNILIDQTGTLKIIDFGSTQIASQMETASLAQRNQLLGTAQYTAPEYFLGETGSPQSDVFSLGVITYQLLTGRLPYGAEVAKARTQAAQNKLHYQPVRDSLDDDRGIPAWIDGVLKKAVHPNPQKRYAELSELVQDLRHPSQAFIEQTRPPLMDRNPLVFWKGLCFALAGVVLVLLGVISRLK